MELVERLPGMCKALGSILSIAKKKKEGIILFILKCATCREASEWLK
jgi:hypothetical protein